MSGFTNDIMNADNVNFTGANPSVGTVTTDGQLMVGSTAAPNIKIGNITSTSLSVGYSSPNITINTIGGGSPIETITGNSGGAESPSAGNFNIVGTGSVTVVGSTNTETVQLTGLTNHAVQVGAGTATLTQVSPSSTVGYPLLSSGSSSDPSFNGAIVGDSLSLPDTTSSSLGVININSNRFLHKFGDANNVFVGANAGNFTNTTALNNTGVGSGALTALTTGDNNVAVGSNALNALTSSVNVTAIGQGAMKLAQTNCSSTIAIGNNAFSSFVSGLGSSSVFIGASSGLNWIGSSQCTLIGTQAGGTGVGQSTNSTGVGFLCLASLTSGIGNSAFGAGSLIGATTGSFNSLFGFQAGGNYTGAESSNILLNNTGTVGESNVCRIGSATGTGQQQLNATFIHGVFGKTVGVSGLPVVVDNVGQFGTVVSSIRYKENIQNISDLSSKILSLRPVIFNYKEKDYKSYGLIAEEVNDVMPELIVKDPYGNVEGVKYQELPILLLNELQKALKRIEELERKLA